MYRIVYGGHDARHKESFCMSRPKGNNDFLLLLVKCNALFTIDRHSFKCHSGCAILIPPGVPYQYRSEQGYFINDYFHFESDAPDFYANSGLTWNAPIPLSNPEHLSRYIRQLVWELHYTPEACRDANLDMLIALIINHLRHNSLPKEDMPLHIPYITALQKLRLSIQAQPYKQYTAEELSRSLKVSPSYFQYLYKAYFGIPYKADLINMRLDYAKDLIANTDMKLEQIALESGYNNEIHFFRQFRQKTCMTPGEYRLYAGRKEKL